MRESWSISVIFLTLIIFVGFSTAQFRASYGEPCSRSTRCDSRASLTCQNGICNCSMSDIMTFENSRCSVLAGEKCTFTTTDEERSWKEDLLCVANSYCEAGFCTCSPTFYEAANGTCIPKSGYQGHCELDFQCRSDGFFICNLEKKQCECNETISRIYGNIQCRKLVGVQCGLDLQNCVLYASCRLPITARTLDEKVCECDELHYFTDTENTCEFKRWRGETCTDDKQCHPDSNSNPLKWKQLCIDFQVSNFVLAKTTSTKHYCDTTQQVYDRLKGNCVGLVDTKCSNSRECTPAAECRERWHSLVCTCKPEYSKSENRTCLASYGRDCTTAECHEGQGTICKRGKCVCKYENQQEFHHDKCTSYTNAPCDDNIPCFENANCIMKDGIQQCVCRDGFISVDGQCHLSIGKRCEYKYNGEIYESVTNAQLTCDVVGGLQCIKGICQCNTLEHYDNELFRCRGLVGSTCLLDNKGYCTSNAVCLKLRKYAQNGNIGICKCIPDWVPTIDRRCVETRENLSENVGHNENEKYLDNFNGTTTGTTTDSP
ncbi:unnamed protein product [Orchesella dallaii]|uniref:EGF-like domain-containing protein n=1 Tax=Orchesella dallaii TaxID=48710 RepID=A0ABP1S491_9HEXA